MPPIPAKSENTAIQIVNEAQDFNPGILKYIHDVTNKDVGLDYHIISVFGSQSTGKSTLLNTLFDTRFDVMTESRRQQTTRGIWLALAGNVASFDSEARPHSNILVMDVEGTDGRERGEDQDFERKAALFALSTSEILIVNIWEHQVGLYQGANLGLLKTVFEVNLSLFANSNPKRCLLLFVIRDHVGNTPLESLAGVLEEDINKIWSEISKPKNREAAQLSDFFDLQFTTLPHKILKPEEFVQDVGKLGDHLTGKNSYFKPQYHKQIPFDGWTVYSENVWKQIIENKELDLPTQQILVSRFRCDEIIKSSIELFETNFNGMIPNFDGKSLPKTPDFDVSKVIGSLKTGPLENYDTLASRYTKSVYLDKRKQLIEKINLKLVAVFKIHLEETKAQAIEIFHSRVANAKKSTGTKSNFTAITTAAVKESLDYYKKHTSSIQDDQSGIFSSEFDYENLVKTLAELVEVQRKKEVHLFSTKYQKKLVPQLKKEVVHLLDTPDNHTWDQVLECFSTLRNKPILPYKKDNQLWEFGLGLSEQGNKDLAIKLSKIAWRLFDSIIHDYLTEDTVVKILREKFEDKFRYDEEGLPLVWKNTVEIDLSFKAGKSAALELLPILAIAKTSDNKEIVPDFPLTDLTDDDEEEDDDADDDEELKSSFAHILNNIQQSQIVAKFKKQIDILYVDAKRSTIQTLTSIPYWIYILIVVLGWNEFMAIIRNPLYFTLLAILLVAAYFINLLNLWGPVKLVVNNTVTETLKVAKDKLRDILISEEDLMKRSSSDEKIVESIPLQDLSSKEKSS